MRSSSHTAISSQDFCSIVCNWGDVRNALMGSFASHELKGAEFTASFFLICFNWLAVLLPPKFLRCLCWVNFLICRFLPDGGTGRSTTRPAAFGSFKSVGCVINAARCEQNRRGVSMSVSSWNIVILDFFQTMQSGAWLCCQPGTGCTMNSCAQKPHGVYVKEKKNADCVNNTGMD